MRPQTRRLEAVGNSAPIVVDRNQRHNYAIGLQAVLDAGSTLTASVQATMDDPHADYPTDYNTDANWFDVTGLSDFTASSQGNIVVPVQAVRLNVSAFTTGGITLTLLQPND